MCLPLRSVFERKQILRVAASSPCFEYATVNQTLTDAESSQELINRPRADATMKSRFFYKTGLLLHYYLETTMIYLANIAGVILAWSAELTTKLHYSPVFDPPLKLMPSGVHQDFIQRRDGLHHIRAGYLRPLEPKVRENMSHGWARPRWMGHTTVPELRMLRNALIPITHEPPALL
eukprot:259649_1